MPIDAHRDDLLERREIKPGLDGIAKTRASTGQEIAAACVPNLMESLPAGYQGVVEAGIGCRTPGRAACVYRQAGALLVAVRGALEIPA